MSIEQKIAELLAESNAAELVAEDEDVIAEDVEELDEEELKPEDDGEEPNNKKNNVKGNPQGKKAVKEDVEQIDELSKKTLSSYATKAHADRIKHSSAAKDAMKDYEDDYGDPGDEDEHGRDSYERSEYHADKADKRKAGMEKAYKKLAKEQIDVSEDVAALTNGEDLSEEFKTKAATIFEAAVVNRVKQEVAALEEEFDAKLEEAVAQTQEALVEKVDGYLNYVVETWIAENEIALERGMKSEILESFVAGMKGLFEEHYIDVPEEKYDLIGEMEETIETLNDKLDEQLAVNVEMKKQLDEAARMDIVASLSEGLADTQKEKFIGLVEELSFEDSETFEKKVQTIRENYFTNKAPTKTITESVVTDEPVSLHEEKVIPVGMKKYVDVLNNLK